jgi:hypothetical protein
MGNCKDCKHWTPDEPDVWWNPAEMGQCGRVIRDADEVTMAVAIYAGSDNYEAQLFYTRPDFGCVLFEAK